ncbi:glycoside hydrolase family 25 protein [Wolbachia endosymbiont of Pentalonia nigronervosa]|jgi:lysozyme|uniref:glycoside hydrolase family 25 protein n=1 Tax=Wolbachia endosymbiont of Pentalonia nigronervosa TaxID=1301914 RepID=UPI00165F4A9E|nr:glycoside hydrolase family 25 protein [Wolbachia endosymbiont of Pentalonia nigronervosa]MBD0392170.1 glycoside hydrolase family 25 protein [Wolbachia endosymbiont of Pentalonia nigronervosa]
MREYQEFLKQLKYIIINSGIIEKEVESKPISEKNGYADAVVDISHWEEDVDFKLAERNGILGVIHKASQGLKYVDSKYAERRKEAENIGLLWGAYHFGVDGDGKDQAGHFLDVVGNDSKVLLALDIEGNEQGKNITPKQAEDFVEKIQEVKNSLPLIYGNANFLKNFATPTLIKCPLWIASWKEKPVLPRGWNNWTLWQYTNGKTAHSVEGIGKCDRNKFNGTLEELRKFWLSGEICF